MSVIERLININSENVPEEYYGKTYLYFSFDMYRDEPINLILGQSLESALVISDLRLLTEAGKERLVDFLKSITVTNPCGFIMHPDLEFVKIEYGIDINFQEKEKVNGGI